MVNTFYYPSVSNVASIYKTTNNGSAPVGKDWNDLSLGANKVVEVIPSRWNITEIGQVLELH